MLFPIGKEQGVSKEDAAIIVADVGGTYARVAWASPRAGHAPSIVGFRRYACAEHAGLADILRDYRQELMVTIGEAPTVAVVAIAGLLDGDRLLNANLPWPVSVERTRAEAGLDALQLVNDFQALAYAIGHADPATMRCLTGQAIHAAHWPALVLGPGTGLGAALRLDSERQPVLPSEVGNAALAAGTALEMDIVRLLAARQGHVGNERILSGPGLVNLYRCLCELRGVAARWSTPAEILDAAANDDAMAIESVQVFCGWLGSLVGDLAITFGARTVYLAGGITAHLSRWLDDGHFLKRYLDKGALSPTLQRIPVWCVEHGQLGVMGAAAWHGDGVRAH